MTQAYRPGRGMKTMALAAAALMALVAVAVVAEDSSADGISNLSADDYWKDGESGDITTKVTLDDAPGYVLFKMYVDDVDDSPDETHLVYVETSGQEVSLSISMDSGSHTVYVYAYYSDESGTQDAQLGTSYYNYIGVYVEKNVWDKATAYIAIVVIAIIIVIAVVYYYRSNPKAKPTTTFTELEEQKKAEKAGQAREERKSSGTERRRYNAGEESAAASEPAPAEPAEKKVSSFTELEEQKKAEKAQKAASAEEKPQKLKYKSSRRK